MRTEGIRRNRAALKVSEERLPALLRRCG
jgi:hypothetical protein